MFTKKKKKPHRASFGTAQSTTSQPRSPNNKQAEDEYLLMKDDKDRENITADDEKYGDMNISDLALHIKSNEIIPDNLENANESFLHKCLTINDNIFGFINFIIVITASLCMLFTIYNNNNDESQWTQQFIIFLCSMIIIPILFIIIRMNIIILHNRYYAEFVHYLLIFLFIIFFVWITVSILINETQTENNMDLLLLISYIILHFFIFNLTSRFWIFIHTQKFNTFLVLYLLTLVAFTHGIIIYIYYENDTFSEELYLFRSYFTLLYITILTYIYSKQLFILCLQLVLASIVTPLLYIFVGYDTADLQDIINYITNGLICVSVLEFIIIFIINTKKSTATATKLKYSKICVLLICSICLLLITFQSIALCIFINENEATWRKLDIFGGGALLWLMLICTFHFAQIPSSVFSNFWKKKVFANFLFLDLFGLQILYNASRIKQYYGGLGINRKFLSLSSAIIAPWTRDYSTINFKHPSYKLCNNLRIGIATTTFIHFHYKLAQESLWRKVFCCICDRKNIVRDDIKYNYLLKDCDDNQQYINGESLEINIENGLQFIEFYPTKFANIRAWNGLSCDVYMKEFSESLLSFIANSKSGMYFFYTSSGKFLIKSLKKSEFYFFNKIFANYYEYLRSNQNTLINKFFGMYGIKCNNNFVYFIVMESIFYSNLNVDIIYDLKGSTKGRISKENEKVLKDLNWKNNGEEVNIGEKASGLYKNQLINDTKFLTTLKIMDYSLLVGVHNVNAHKNENNYRVNDTFHYKAASPYLFTFCHRGMISRDKKQIYFAGIIDILQKYNAKKKVENVMRRIKSNQKAISCAPPQVYADRMCDFLDEYIV